MLCYGGLDMKVNRLTMSPEEQAQMEHANHTAKKQEALVQYIAMMTDIELPEESEEITHEQEV